jgi:chromosome segregation ATPase
MPPDDEYDDEYDAEPAILDDVVEKLDDVVEKLEEIKTELSELGTLGSIENRLVDIESASERVADCLEEIKAEFLEEIKAELSDLGTTVGALEGELQNAVLWVLVVLGGLGIARLSGCP